MDLLVVARQSADLPATDQEVDDPGEALAMVQRLPHGPIVAPLLRRVALGVIVLASDLDRTMARAAIGVAIQRTGPKGVVLLGTTLSRELLGEALPLVGGIRELHSRPVAGIGQAKQPDIERLLGELTQRAHVAWAPPSQRAVAARVVARAEDAESQATLLLEQQKWAEAVRSLRGAEPLGPRGTNMLGRALLQLGDRDGARHAFERTLQTDPGNAIAQRQLASLGADGG